jgi:hypothetical protein
MSLMRDDVAYRIRESWDTLRRVPAHGIMGFKSSWPEYVRDALEAYGYDAVVVKLSPASPQAIDRMNESFGWFKFLEGERHLTIALWMTVGRGMGVHRAGCILGIHRHTVRHRREEALGRIVDGLHRHEIAIRPIIRQYTGSPLTSNSMRVLRTSRV